MIILLQSNKTRHKLCDTRDLEIVTALTTAIDKIQRDDCTYADFEKAMKWLDRVIKNLTEATETQKAKIT